MGNGSGKTISNDVSKPVFPEFLRIVVLGDSFVGKTCLCRTYESGRFEENTNLRIGCSKHDKTVTVQNRNLKLFLFNLAGNERYHELWPFYCKFAEGILLLYDIESIRSFKSLPKWLEVVKKAKPKAPLFIVGARSDRHENRKVTFQEGKQFARERNLRFYECSSKDGINVNEVFEDMVYMILLQKNLISNFQNKALFREGKESENSVCFSTNTFAESIDSDQKSVNDGATLCSNEENVKTYSEKDNLTPDNFEEGTHKAESSNSSLLQAGEQICDAVDNSNTHFLEKDENKETSSQDGNTKNNGNGVSSKSNRSLLSEEEMLFIGKCF